MYVHTYTQHARTHHVLVRNTGTIHYLHRLINRSEEQTVASNNKMDSPQSRIHSGFTTPITPVHWSVGRSVDFDPFPAVPAIPVLPVLPLPDLPAGPWPLPLPLLRLLLLLLLQEPFSWLLLGSAPPAAGAAGAAGVAGGASSSLVPVPVPAPAPAAASPPATVAVGAVGVAGTGAGAAGASLDSLAGALAGVSSGAGGSGSKRRCRERLSSSTRSKRARPLRDVRRRVRQRLLVLDLVASSFSSGDCAMSSLNSSSAMPRRYESARGLMNLLVVVYFYPWSASVQRPSSVAPSLTFPSPLGVPSHSCPRPRTGSVDPASPAA